MYDLYEHSGYAAVSQKARKVYMVSQESLHALS